MATPKKYRPFLFAVLIALAVVLGAGIYVWHEENRPRIFEMYDFALNSGRSVFIRTPNDKRILIDGGANSEVIKRLTDILPFYSRHIDFILATNTDGKNVSGLIDIIKRYSVDELIVPDVTLESLKLASSTDLIYSTLIDTAKNRSVPIQAVMAGDSIVFDPGNVIVDMLFPATSSAFQYSKASEPSIAMRVKFGRISFVLLGDATPKVQKFIASQRVGRVNVLIVSNSASPSTLAPQLTDVLKPEYLIYSKIISRNHPKTKMTSKKEIDPLRFIPENKRFNLKEKGTVKIESDGVSISVK